MPDPILDYASKRPTPTWPSTRAVENLGLVASLWPVGTMVVAVLLAVVLGWQTLAEAVTISLSVLGVGLCVATIWGLARTRAKAYHYVAMTLLAIWNLFWVACAIPTLR